ncbi:MAG: hypothetical protein ACUVUF_06905 [Candidatus Bathycorpusculaceae bacterium]
MVKKVRLEGQELAEAVFLDAENRKAVTSMVENGEIATFIAGFVSYFDDDVVRECDGCREKVSVRPWAIRLIEQHGLKVLCVKCAGKAGDVHRESFKWLRKLAKRRLRPYP